MPYGGLAWLTSGGGPQGRFDILTAAPNTRVRYDGATLEIGERRLATSRPLDTLAAELPVPSAAATEPLAPFSTGFIGYLGYGLHATCERQVAAPPDPTGMPQLAGGLYGWALIADHEERTLRLIGQPPEDIAGSIRSARNTGGGYALAAPFSASMDARAYRRAIGRLLEHIHAGDCYQVNLARHFSAPCIGDPLAVLADFKRLQGAAYSALLDYPEGTVLSVSPERFVRGRAGRVSTWPIKGTAPRSRNPAKDRSFAEALLRSEKDRAENLMIVDLLRNDLGKVCEFGSVTVEALCHLTQHRNVHHLQSVISGTLRSGLGPWETLAALFPCGSITGAPKIKAIDIINSLEPVGRSAYCGAIGYIDQVSGQFDFNVAIRTAVLCDNTLHVWGGGGIVADSTASAELEEIDAKVGRLLSGLDQLR